MAWATATGMDIMGRLRSRNKSLPQGMATNLCLGLLLVTCLTRPACARILGATVTPTLNISQSYSDNLRLGSSSSSVPSSGSHQGGFVTQLSPMLRVVRDSARSRFNLTARLQYLQYEDVNINSRLYPQLQMSTNTEVFDDSVFIDSSSRIAQGNASSFGSISSSNLNQSNVNSTTYSSFNISPYWRPHMGGYANGELRVGYYYFGNNNSATGAGTSTANNSIANLGSYSLQESVHLTTGRQFDSTGIAGRMSINNQERHYQSRTTNDTRFRSYNGELRYNLLNDIGAFVQAGYYDNAYPNRAPTHNGLYVTPGLYWVPSPNFNLAAGYGYNSYFVNMSWHPSQNTSFSVNYRDSQVGGSSYGLSGLGLGTSGLGGSSSLYGNTGIAGFDYNPAGNNYGQINTSSQLPGSTSPTGALGAPTFGSNWNGSFHHNTRATSWSISYLTTTTTIQQYLSSDLYSSSTAANFYTDERDTSLPDLTNSVMVIKRIQGSVSWKLPRSSVVFRAYQTNTNYLSSLRNKQDTFGVSASWTWLLSPRVSTSFTGTWQSSDRKSSNTNNNSSQPKTEYLSASVSLNRHFSSSVTGSLQFTHYQSDSSNLTNPNVLGYAGSYDSNRVTASLLVNF